MPGAHHDVPGELFLALQSGLFLWRARPSTHQCAKRRGRDDRRGDRHDHGDDIRGGVEHAEVETDGRDDDAEGAAGVERHAEGESLPMLKPGHARADPRATELRHRGEQGEQERPEQHGRVGEQGDVDAKAGGGEEHRG